MHRGVRLLLFMHRGAEIKMLQSCLRPAWRAGKINLLCLIAQNRVKKLIARAARDLRSEQGMNLLCSIAQTYTWEVCHKNGARVAWGVGQ